MGVFFSFGGIGDPMPFNWQPQSKTKIKYNVKYNRWHFVSGCYLSSSMYVITSSTLHSSILQKTSMVCVLTLSLRFNRVICAGLML
jgi:hypothetical protein